MWIFLNNAFLSIVDKGDKTGQTLLVRARRHEDIKRVFPDADIVEGAGTDYRYRARVDRKIVARAIADSVRDIRYPNFKSSVEDRSRHDAYMDVWAAMLRL
jgi:hypothetical protein